MPVVAWLGDFAQGLPIWENVKLVLAGTCYVSGAVMWALQRPNPHPYFQHHEVMHVLSTTGAALVFSVLQDVMAVSTI